MRRLSIIIHSVSGNIYILGSYLKEKLQEQGIDARLYRVEDQDLHIWANKQDSANDYLEDILALPIASTQTLKKSDMVILGSPTRFGNMTAEMKAFLDTTFELSEDRSLAGTLFGCFTSCVHSVCEGSHALDSMLYWAQNMGMIHIPYGVHQELHLRNQPITGIVHLEGKDCNLIRPSGDLEPVLDAYIDTVVSYLT